MDTTSINYNLGSCNPIQVINVTYPIEDISKLSIYGANGNSDNANWKNLDSSNNGEIGKDCILYAYSLDSVCWSCFMSYDDLLKNTVDLNGDFAGDSPLNGSIKSSDAISFAQEL